MKKFVLLCAALLVSAGIFVLIRFPFRSERKNVILITVDALRPDHLGCYGYSRPTSPKVDAWAAKGVVFKNVVAQASWTTPGLMALFTGLTPPAHGVEMRGKFLLPVVQTLPKILKNSGYKIPNLTYLTSEISFTNLGYAPARDNLLPQSDKNLVSQYILEHSREKFFIWYHYRFVHLPYNPPQEYERIFLNEEKLPESQRKRLEVIKKEVLYSPKINHFFPQDTGPVQSLYNADIRRFDDFFGEILSALKSTRLEKNTVVILTADHGEELFDHGWIGHASSGNLATLYDEVIKIPLIIVAPELLPSNKVFQPPVRQIDILPTLLSLLEIPCPSYVQGRSLLPYLDGSKTFFEKPAFSQTTLQGYRTKEEDQLFRLSSLRTSEWKLIMHSDSSGVRFELYRLKDDPHEKKNLAGRLPGKTKEMEMEMSQIIRKSLALNANFEMAQEKEEKPISGGRVQGAPLVVEPKEDQKLDYTASKGYVEIRWKGPQGLDYEVQYRIGKGIYSLAGSVFVSGNSHRFGPFQKENWDSYKLWNPWNFRVRVKGEQNRWSSWTTFSL